MATFVYNSDGEPITLTDVYSIEELEAMSRFERVPRDKPVVVITTNQRVLQGYLHGALAVTELESFNVMLNDGTVYISGVLFDPIGPPF